MILVDTNVVIRSYEAAEALLPSKSPVGGAHPPTDPLEQIDGAWRKLLAASEVGTIPEVLAEITKAPGTRWKHILENDFRHLVAKQTDQYYKILGEIHHYVRTYWPAHDADAFLKAADPHLIAMAAANGWAVATLESPAVPQIDRGATRFSGAIKLPYIAWRFGVPIKTIYDLFTAPGRR